MLTRCSTPFCWARPPLTRQLTTEEELDAPLEACMPVVLRLMCAAAVEVNQEYDAAANNLNHYEDDDDDDDDEPRRTKGRKSGMARKVAQRQEEGAVALHTNLGKCLGPLLEKFGAHAEPLRGVLALLRQLRLSAAHASLKGKRFDEVLLQLETATLKHTDQRTLAACASAWQSLMSQTGAPVLQEAVQVRYRRLVSKLQAAVRPLSAALKKKSADPPPALLEEAEIGLRRLEHLTKEHAQSLPQLKGLTSKLAGLAENSEELMRPIVPPQPAPPRGPKPGGKKSSRGPSPQSSTPPADKAEPLPPPLAGCLASVMRTLTAQFVFSCEALFINVQQSTRAPLGSRRDSNAAGDDEGGAGAAAVRLSDEAKSLRKTLTNARKELLPALLRTCRMLDQPYMQTLGVELVCTTLTAMKVVSIAVPSIMGRSYSGAEGDDDDDEEEEEEGEEEEGNTGDWFSDAQACVIESIRSLIASLVVNGKLPSPPKDEPHSIAAEALKASYAWPDGVQPARWLYHSIKLLIPGEHEFLPRPRSLAVLLSAPEEACEPLGLPGMLKLLWKYYGEKLTLEDQAEMEAHALVAATAVPTFDRIEVCEDDEEAYDPLGPAQAAAESLVRLHEDASITSKDRLQGLLEKLIIRGMRWAFAQSHNAIQQSRGAWVDAAMLPLLALADGDTCRAIDGAVSDLKGSVAQLPEMDEFDAAMVERLQEANATPRIARKSGGGGGKKASVGASEAAAEGKARPAPTRAMPKRNAGDQGRSRAAAAAAEDDEGSGDDEYDDEEEDDDEAEASMPPPPARKSGSMPPPPARTGPKPAATMANVPARAASMGKRPLHPGRGSHSASQASVASSQASSQGGGGGAAAEEEDEEEEAWDGAGIDMADEDEDPMDTSAAVDDDEEEDDEEEEEEEEASGMSLPLGTEEDMLAAPRRSSSVYDQPQDDEDEEEDDEEAEEDDEDDDGQSVGGASESQRSAVMPSYAAVGRSRRAK